MASSFDELLDNFQVIPGSDIVPSLCVSHKNKAGGVDIFVGILSLLNRSSRHKQAMWGKGSREKTIKEDSLLMTFEPV